MIHYIAFSLDKFALEACFTAIFFVKQKIFFEMVIEMHISDMFVDN